MSPLPDATWLGPVADRLAADDAWQAQVERLGTPLVLEVHQGDVTRRILVPQGDAGRPHVLEGDPPEDAIPVSMDADTWEGLLSGRVDLMNAYFTGDIKVKAGMMKLMKIATPAEKIVSLLSRAHQEAHR